MGGITVLWLTDGEDVPRAPDARYQHVVGDPERPAATITRLVSEGPVLAVVRSEDEGRRALALGVDDFVLAAHATGDDFELTVARTVARARGRLLRDLWLVDLVRKDDTTALELLANALGRELGEPLRRIADESRRLVETPDAERPERAARAGLIADSVQAMARVVERMQELVDTRPTDEVVDFVEVVQDVVRSLEASARQVGRLDLQVVEVSCRVGLPRWQAALVVANLVANAVEAVAARGAAEGAISVRLSREEDSVVLEISDNGVGMDATTRTHASELFFSTERATRLGLGLPLVSARVRRAGGEVMIDSEPGVGTTVRVFLPLLDAPPRVPARSS
ncbi:MAG: sensor histidine kinase [Myxococcales bacterium]|nr:sensor histidine kinase [Myxococcales bacterium]